MPSGDEPMLEPDSAPSVPGGSGDEHVLRPVAIVTYLAEVETLDLDQDEASLESDAAKFAKKDGLIGGMPDAKALDILNGLITFVEDLSKARSEWGGPHHPRFAACLSLAAVLKFLQRVDRPDPEDRHRPLTELYGALVSLHLDGIVVPLLMPKPGQGRRPLSVAERATRILAVAIADTAAEVTGMSRQEADRMVAKKLESWGFPFGRDGTSGADQGPAVERFARLRRALGRSDCPEEDRAAYQGHKTLLAGLVSDWPGTASAAERKKAREWLLSVLEKEVKARGGIVAR